MTVYRKAADLPDDAVIRAVAEANARNGGIWASRWEIAAVIAGKGHLVTPGLAADPGLYEDQPGLPPKVLLAKLRRLMGRGGPRRVPVWLPRGRVHTWRPRGPCGS